MASPTYMPEYNASWALVMGVDDYQHLRPLSAAVRGAEELAAVLRDRYAFDVTCLKDHEITRDAAFGWLNEVRRKAVPDDRVLIYFAGHGLTRGTAVHERGYLALADSRRDEWHTTLAMDDVAEEARYIKAKHLLYLLDCCFGGLVLENRAEADMPRELDYYLTRPVRYAISAGGKEVVDDAMAPGGEHSLFTYHLLDWLTSERVAPPGGIWRARELGNYLERAVAHDRRSGHKPNHNYLPGSGDGDFLFRWEVGPRLPRDLEMALGSEMGYVRWGAVAALIGIARGDDPDLASLAREWLERMAHDDPDERVRGAAQSFFDEEEALWLAEEDRIRQAEAEARLEEARRQQEEAARALHEAERRAEEERQRLEAAERERQEALERARKAREIMPPSVLPKPTVEAPSQVTPLPTPPGRPIRLSVLVTAIGWAIGWAIGAAIVWDVYEAIGWAIGGAIGGAIAGLTIGLELRRVEPSTRWKQVGLVTLGWAIGAAIAFIGVAISWDTDSAIGWAIGGAIGWAIGGVITGLALRQVEPSTQWKQVGLVTLGWAIGAAIALIGVAIGWDTDSAIEAAIAGAIDGAIGGAIGAGVTFWQLGRARRAKMNASPR